MEPVTVGGVSYNSDNFPIPTNDNQLEDGEIKWQDYLQMMQLMEEKPRLPGYCEKTKSTLVYKNSKQCKLVDGSNGAKTDVGYHLTVVFYEPETREWELQIGSRWSRGGVILLDGSLYDVVEEKYTDWKYRKVNTMWTPDRQFPITKGWHTLEFFYGNPGPNPNQEQSEIRYRRYGSKENYSPNTLTKASLKSLLPDVINLNADFEELVNYLDAYLVVDAKEEVSSGGTHNNTSGENITVIGRKSSHFNVITLIACAVALAALSALIALIIIRKREQVPGSTHSQLPPESHNV